MGTRILLYLNDESDTEDIMAAIDKRKEKRKIIKILFGPRTGTTPYRCRKYKNFYKATLVEERYTTACVRWRGLAFAT